MGYIVIAMAITTGSGNNFDTKENEMKTLIPKRVAKRRKLEKWVDVNKANTPHCELASNVAPLKKYAENIIKMQVNKLLRKSRR